MVGKCIDRGIDGGIITYAHNDSVTAWTPIYVIGLGVLVAMVSAAANVAIGYRRAGVFGFIVANGVAIAKGDKVFYDATNGAIQLTAPATGFFLGTSQGAGTGNVTGTVLVDVEINTYETAFPELTNIYVSPNGDDAYGDGSKNRPYKTIAKAVSVESATRKTILLEAGSYTANEIDITVSGTVIRGLGEVTVKGAEGADYCFKTVFGATTGTKSLTMKNLNINHDDDNTQIGIQIINTGATAKVNVYLDDVNFGADGGNSIDIDNVATGHAIRCYCDRCTTEGPVNIVVKDNGDRFRFSYGNLRGGLVTDDGNYDAEILIAWSSFKVNGITGGHANQRAIFIASASETDADPNVYAEAVAADVETQTPQILEFDAVAGG